MTTIDTLPYEILGMIFVISLSSQRSVLSPFKPFSSRSYVTSHLGYHNRTDAPFVFLQVCSRWRSVAISCRVLWASLSMCQYGHATSTGMPLVALGYWLSLSENLPLHIFVGTPRNYQDGGRRRGEPAVSHSQKLMAELAKDRHLSRWKSISAVLTPALCAQLTETLIHDYSALQSPLGLERIEIVLSGHFSVTPTRLLYAIGIVSSLRELFWSSEHPSRFQAFIELLPLRQLTKIFLHIPISVYEATMFLAKCKTVTHVTLIKISTYSQDIPPSIETLHGLTKLTLYGTQNVLAILDSIQCPALKVLDINNRMHRPPHLSWESLHCFFKRSQSELNSAVIQFSANLSPVDLAGYLRVGQEFDIPYYMVSCRDAHATAHSLLRREDSLRPFMRYIGIPGGQEYVGMDCMAEHAKHFDKIRLRQVSTRPLRSETVLCPGVRARLSTYLCDATYAPVFAVPSYFPV